MGEALGRPEGGCGDPSGTACDSRLGDARPVPVQLWQGVPSPWPPPSPLRWAALSNLHSPAASPQNQQATKRKHDSEPGGLCRGSPRLRWCLLPISGSAHLSQPGAPRRKPQLHRLWSPGSLVNGEQPGLEASASPMAQHRVSPWSSWASVRPSPTWPLHRCSGHLQGVSLKLGDASPCSP